MKDFFRAAFPWVAIGLSLAIVFVNASKHRKDKAKGGNSSREGKKNDEYDNYMAEGMSFGMCIGVTLGSIGFIDLSMGISLGMVIGLVCGMNIKKKDRNA